MKYVLLHGTMGNPQENRFPRLQEQLESQGHVVYVPHFPTPDHQSLESRCEVLVRDVPFTFDSDTILVGHSLGALYILHILDREREEKIAKAVLVSGFTSKLGNEQFDTLNASFLSDEFDRERIKGNAKEIYVFHGEDDPYVPLEQAVQLQKRLGAESFVIQGGGHLNEAAGYLSFDELLQIL